MKMTSITKKRKDTAGTKRTRMSWRKLNKCSYVHAHLRVCTAEGDTSFGSHQHSFDEIDVNSFQSNLTDISGTSSNHLLIKTKSAGFIIQVVMDKLDNEGLFLSVENNDSDMRSKWRILVTIFYFSAKQIPPAVMFLAQCFKKIQRMGQGFLMQQLDDNTEGTIKELRQKVARRCWKCAISAVHLMIRLGCCYMNRTTFL
jgi:hypothetical protein